MSQTAFVTGGNGFVGLNLIELLCNEGWNVTALYLPNSGLTYLGQFPVDLKEGSVTDIPSLENALPMETDVVFHLAADLNYWSRNNARQTTCNVDGTRNMMNVASRKRVKRFIHTSSIAAWGNVTGTVTEDTPQKGHDSWINYEKTKWAAEQEVLKGVDGNMEVVILNLVAVIGPYDINNFGRLFMALKKHSVPAIPDGVFPASHVREVAKAHITAARNGRNGERYILPGEDCTWAEFYCEVAKVMGKPCPSRRLPVPLFKFIVRLWDIASKFTGNEPQITPENADLITRKNVTYCGEKAIKELGYQIVPMRKAVQDCYDWLVKENLL
jgi:dihydroflavonol-4-reductase